MAKETAIAWMWLTLFRLVVTLLAGWLLAQKLLGVFLETASVFLALTRRF